MSTSEIRPTEVADVLASLRHAADLYQATVRPHRHDDSLDDERRFERQKQLQQDLLNALGEAHEALRVDRADAPMTSWERHGDYDG